MKYFLILFGLLSSSFLTHAQDGTCGTMAPSAEQLKLIREMPRKYIASPVAKSIYPLRKLPLRFHIVSKSDGSGGVLPDTLREELKRVNSYYVNAGMEFFICSEPDTIRDDSLFNYQYFEEMSPKIQDMLDARSIDVFFFNSIYSDTIELCGYTYFPGMGPESDLLMMSNKCINGSTLVHELGHYFTLPHTHGFSNFGTTDELVDGTNCDVAGDFICDTPADPNLFRQVDSSCKFTGISKDANGVPYAPLVNNIMSYSRKSCVNSLTPMQYATIRNGYEEFREYLCCSAPVLKFKISQSGRTVTFIDSSEYSVSSEWTFSDGNSINSASGSHTFDKPGIYSITLRSMNSCGDATETLQVNLLHVSILNQQQAFLYPNPSSAEIHIQLAENSSCTNLEIYDIRGLLLSNLTLIPVNGLITIPSESLTDDGIYLIKVQTDSGTLFFKAVLSH